MTELWMQWWVWVALAMVLALVELATSVYLALGFAIGAVLVGAIVGIMVVSGMELGFSAVFITFTVLSLAAWLVLLRFYSLGKQVKTYERDIND